MKNQNVIDKDKEDIQQIINSNRLPNVASHVAVFIDGSFAPHFTSLPDTIKVCKNSEHDFQLSISDNIAILEPLHLIFLSTSKSTTLKNNIEVGSNSKITIIEEHLEAKDSNNLFKINTRIHTKKNAQVAYYKLFNAPTVIHQSQVQLEVGENSSLSTTHLLLSGRKITEFITANLIEPQAHSNNSGLYILSQEQQLELTVNINHLTDNCTSKELFKGIAQEKAQAVFVGKITVKENTKHNTARLDNKNLLLHETARIKASPSLEIYADDVRCSHGATIGQLDDSALWYLQARGIPLVEAKSILIDAFAQEIINSLPLYLQEKIKYAYRQ